MGFDMYNMSDAISQGNALSSSVEGLNEQIRANNALSIKNAKDAAKNAVAGDKETGLLGGIRGAISEGGAVANTIAKVNAYTDAIKKAGAAGQAAVSQARGAVQGVTDCGFTSTGSSTGSGFRQAQGAAEAAVSQARGAAQGAAQGITDAVSKPAAAIQTSEGTLAEGSSILSKGKGIVAAGATGAEEAGSLGLKVASGIGKAAGTVTALGTAGLDIYSDIESFKHGGSLIAGDNLGEKIANIGSIGGAALDMLGFVPGFQLAGVIGAGLQAASGAIDAGSEAVHTATQVAQDKTPAPVTQIQQVAQASLAGSFANVRSQ
jgi:hypothetical protein